MNTNIINRFNFKSQTWSPVPTLPRVLWNEEELVMCGSNEGTIYIVTNKLIMTFDHCKEKWNKLTNVPERLHHRKPETVTTLGNDVIIKYKSEYELQETDAMVMIYSTKNDNWHNQNLTFASLSVDRGMGKKTLLVDL